MLHVSFQKGLECMKNSMNSSWLSSRNMRNKMTIGTSDDPYINKYNHDELKQNRIIYIHELVQLIIKGIKDKQNATPNLSKKYIYKRSSQQK